MIRELLIASLVLVCIGNVIGEFPKYITEEEFAKARCNPIVANNSRILPLPTFDEANVAHPRPGFGPRLWTNAEVPYTLDPNFSASQREDVARALDAFHRDTCIRFIPKTGAHGSWVDILYDAEVCGVAHVCMNTGAQFAKFGGTCVNPGTMVHELGHTLCMGHEQTRRDRDRWISFNTAICQPHGMDGPDFNRGLHKLYDYVSIEHYEGECYNGCFVPAKSGVTKCGSGGPLAVLDIEILNEMYNCGGCHSYRYINSNSQLINPVQAGTNFDGTPTYPCRAYHNADIVPGKYNMITRECHVAHNGGEHAYRDDVEVLCNPSGANFQWVRAGTTPPANAIRGGRSRERETLYNIRCEVTRDGRTTWIPGKYQSTAGAYTSWGGQEIRCGVYDFMVCV